MSEAEVLARVAPEFEALCRRLLANVRAGAPDQAERTLEVPAASYRDSVQWRCEMDRIFHRMPLLTALSCDLPNPGDFVSYVLAEKPLVIMRGDDGVVRTMLNVCRHRGAKVVAEPCGNTERLICPYHSWSYDRHGALTGLPDRDSFGAVDVRGLVQLPTVERAGAVFSVLTPEHALDLDMWLAGLLPSLEALRLDELYPYKKTTTLASPNWKLAADGYLDGYHIGFLHRQTIGGKAINNRNTYDLFGPHARIGFATKRITELAGSSTIPGPLPDYMSLVHFVFPNVSMSGGHGDTLMLSRLFPGPTVAESTTVQHHYFRQPVEGALAERAEERRQTYERVVRDEDCATIFGISDALGAMDHSPIVFGRNEPANQRLHQFVSEVTLRGTDA